ncbi:hypothetical protein [Stenotrophomonas maltophilia]|uniref:hypothetical protein n=1 Tax=Stenotrophomonas maltophilia TaxID=40324 RepID=UPI00313F234D
MVKLWVVAVFLAAAAAVMALIGNERDATEYTRKENRLDQQHQIAQGIDVFVQLNGRPPVDLEELTGTPGLEHLRTARNAWQRYETSGQLVDGTWQFQRAAAWTAVREDGGVSYRNENRCGSGNVATSASWCGATDGDWYRYETRETYNEQMSQQRARMTRTLQLFADYWSTHQAFPFRGNDGGVLGAGGQRSLASLAGFSGTAGNCGGVYVWAGIPLDCGALFDHWGRPVKYQYQSPLLMVLSTETPFLAANGRPVVIATPLQVQE